MRGKNFILLLNLDAKSLITLNLNFYPQARGKDFILLLNLDAIEEGNIEEGLQICM